MQKSYLINASVLDFYYVEYFTIEVLESNNDKIYLKRNENGAFYDVQGTCTIQYSKNGGN